MSDNKDLPKLTDKQFTFVQGILEGKTASDAYRASYDCNDWLDSSIWCEASKLRSSTTVLQWLEAARQKSLGKHVVTLESHLDELDRLKQLAERDGVYGAAVKATELKGKVSGLYVERVRNEDTRSDIELLAEIRRLSPDAADALERDLGLKVSLMDDSEGPSKLTH